MGFDLPWTRTGKDRRRAKLIDDHNQYVLLESDISEDKESAMPQFRNERDQLNAARLFIRESVERARVAPFYMIVTLTPSLAAALLEVNEANRKLKPFKLAAYERSVKSGQWELNGENLIVSHDGKLNDGQHRCFAVVNTGASIETAIGFGFARQTRDSLDQGGERKAADDLSMFGHKNPIQLAALAGWIWQYKDHQFLSNGGSLRPQKGDVAKTINNEGAELLSRHISGSVGGGTLAAHSVMAFCHWLITTETERKNLPRLAGFYEKLTKGVYASRPIACARAKLAKTRRDPSFSASLIITAWNYEIRGINTAFLDTTAYNGKTLPEVE